MATSPNARLLDAAATGKLRAVQAALQDGADVNAREQPRSGSSGATALCLAARLGHKDVVDHLLQLPTVDILCRDEAGRNAADNARFNGFGIIEGCINAVAAAREMLKKSQPQAAGAAGEPSNGANGDVEHSTADAEGKMSQHLLLRKRGRPPANRAANGKAARTGSMDDDEKGEAKPGSPGAGSEEAGTTKPARRRARGRRAQVSESETESESPSDEDYTPRRNRARPTVTPARTPSNRQAAEAAREAARLMAALSEDSESSDDDGGDEMSEAELQDNTNGVSFEPVASGTAEYSLAEHRMAASLPNARIVSVQKVVYPAQLELFLQEREVMFKRLGASRLNERRLFLGTGKKKVATTVLANAPKFKLEPTQENYCGLGVYLAERASYANHFAYHRKVKGKGDLRELLIVRALCGSSKKAGDRRITHETQWLKGVRRTERDREYDSVSTGPWGEGDHQSMLCLMWSMRRMFPEFIVTYSLVPAAAGAATATAAP